MTGSVGPLPPEATAVALEKAPETDREENLSTQQAGSQAPPRLSRPHGDQGWPQGHRRPSRSRPQAPVGLSVEARDEGAPVPEDWPIAMRLARLTQRKEFLAAADKGRRFRSPAFTAQVRDALPEEERSELRLGLTASRKTGNAVKRNRIRRRLRAAAAEALRDQAATPCDIVIVARPEVLGADFQALVADLSIAIDRARPQKPHADRRRPREKKRVAPAHA